MLASTIGWLCEGQIEELRHTYDTTRTEASYFTSIQGKTASLFGTAARIGGIVAGSDRGLIDALTEYGNSFGIVFQIVDDILDVTATEDQLGKPAGHDIVEGVYTLPVLRTLALGRSVSDELGDLLGRPLDVGRARQGVGDRPLERGGRERGRHGPSVRRRRRGRLRPAPDRHSERCATHRAEPRSLGTVYTTLSGLSQAHRVRRRRRGATATDRAGDAVGQLGSARDRRSQLVGCQPNRVAGERAPLRDGPRQTVHQRRPTGEPVEQPTDLEVRAVVLGEHAPGSAAARVALFSRNASTSTSPAMRPVS